MITIKGLSKSFEDKNVLNNLSAKFNGGLNFIVGSSGSGKTTLLKILSGIDKAYEGEVLFKDKSLKEYTSEEINSYYYNSVGFIWQNFNLIDYMTVEENIELVLNLGNDSEETIKRKTKDVLSKLGIDKFSKAKVNTLSGGQKQRVAIARVLVKNPEVIIADEPTGALDKKSAKVTMDILRKIAKNKLVIVVTHDKSLIEEDDNVYELYKGTLKEKLNNNLTISEASKKRYIKPHLRFKNGISYTVKSFKGRLTKNILTAVVISLASLFLVINLSGQVVNEQQEIIDTLVQQRGDRLRDITIANNRMNTFGSDENTAFKQDVSEYLYEYNDDPRIENFLLVQFINDIKINIPGITENYEVDSMGTSPAFDKIVEGKLPSLKGREVAVSSELVKNLGLEPKDIIGKTINVGAWTYDEGEIPRSKVDLTLNDIKIVGVIDSTINLKNQSGERVKTNREDSMFFSLDVVNEIKNTIGSKQNNVSFTMRVKEIKDIMPIVEELNSKGIIAIGEFEDVKDILQISDISTNGSKAVTTVLAVVGVIAVLVISVINFYMRRYEYSVLKINGYSKNSLLKLNLFEGLILTVASALSLFIIFIPINSLVLSRFDIQLSGINSALLTVGVLIIVNIIAALIGYIISVTTNIGKSLMTGER